MDEIKVNAVNLKSFDYMESDKILTLFTYEKGVLSAKIKGVKKAQAKLKFASEPFCFGEYLLCSSKGGYIVTASQYKELFYDLRKDLEKFTAGCAMLSFCGDFVQEDEPNVKLFSCLLNCLNALCYTDTSPLLIMIFFLINALNFCGYDINYSKCCNCGGKIGEKAYIYLNGGGFLCGDCCKDNSMLVPQPVYKVFKFISQTQIASLATIKLETKNAMPALKYLNNFICDITGKCSKSLSEFISMPRP